MDRKALSGELARLAKPSNLQIGIGRTDVTEQAAEELGAFFAGKSAAFRTPLAPLGSPFAQTVWDALRDIPAGETQSYSAIASQIGRASASRAVARANVANQIALMIPCHRVIGADGSLTGYGGGLWRKQRLLEIERTYRDLRRTIPT
jgi:AraC family transcriptional regulator of adaptative response/methylated-DNA-[protein]-cysteine methyltransferase